MLFGAEPTACPVVASQAASQADSAQLDFKAAVDLIDRVLSCWDRLPARQRQQLQPELDRLRDGLKPKHTATDWVEL